MNQQTWRQAWSAFRLANPRRNFDPQGNVWTAAARIGDIWLWRSCRPEDNQARRHTTVNQYSHYTTATYLMVMVDHKLPLRLRRVTAVALRPCPSFPVPR